MFVGEREQRTEWCSGSVSATFGRLKRRASAWRMRAKEHVTNAHDTVCAGRTTRAVHSLFGGRRLARRWNAGSSRNERSSGRWERLARGLEQATHTHPTLSAVLGERGGEGVAPTHLTSTVDAGITLESYQNRQVLAGSSSLLVLITYIKLVVREPTD